IVLVTAYMNYALDGYKVKASRFLLKDNLSETIGECMDDLIVEIQKNSRILEFSFVEGTMSLRAADIIYIETARHKNIFYTKKGNFSILSFLVNMSYIAKISSYVLTLTTGKEISVPKSRYVQVKRQYMLSLF
ncbi:MAG: DNA-binding response regulator, partial [Agathobacter sp.]|nr:DNA-binding response regulator [Agathobacter sp.]